MTTKSAYRPRVRAQDFPPRVRLTQLAEALFDGSPHPLVLTDEDGIIGWVNRRFVTATGRSPADLEGQSLEDFVRGAGEALKKLRTSDSVAQSGRLRGAAPSASELQMQAVRSNGRGPTTILWWMLQGRVEDAVSTPGFRPEFGKTTSAPSTGLHLDALRLLHELALTESTIDLSVKHPKS